MVNNYRREDPHDVAIFRTDLKYNDLKDLPEGRYELYFNGIYFSNVRSHANDALYLIIFKIDFNA